MAEIQVERRRTSSATGWMIALVLLALLGAGWYFTMGPGSSTQAEMNETRPVTPAPAPSSP